jgi:hypothetical protein
MLVSSPEQEIKSLLRGTPTVMGEVAYYNPGVPGLGAMRQLSSTYFTRFPQV